MDNETLIRLLSGDLVPDAASQELLLNYYLRATTETIPLSEANSFRNLEIAACHLAKNAADNVIVRLVLESGSKLLKSRLALNPAIAAIPDVVSSLYDSETDVSELGANAVVIGKRQEINNFGSIAPSVVPFLQIAQIVGYRGQIFTREGALTSDFVNHVVHHDASIKAEDQFKKVWVNKTARNGRMDGPAEASEYNVGVNRPIFVRDGRVLSAQELLDHLSTGQSVPQKSLGEMQDDFVRRQIVAGKLILPAQVEAGVPLSAIYKPDLSAGQHPYSIHEALASNPHIGIETQMRLAGSAIPAVLFDLARFSKNRDVQEALLAKTSAEVMPMVTDCTMTPERVIEGIQLFLALNPDLDSTVEAALLKVRAKEGSDHLGILAKAREMSRLQRMDNPSANLQVPINLMATLGPTNSNQEIMDAQARAGFTSGRVTSAYNSPITYALLALHWRARNPAATAFFDLSGGKLRTGPVASQHVGISPSSFTKGAVFTLTEENVEGDLKRIQVKGITELAQTGDTVRLDDENLILEVTGVDKAGGTVECVIKEVKDALFYDKCGVAFPDRFIAFRAVTTQEYLLLEEAARLGVMPDEIGISFVQSAEDVKMVQRFLDSLSLAYRPKIAAKIETVEALKHLDDIVGVSDRVMIARGDLTPALKGLRYHDKFNELKTASLGDAELGTWYDERAREYGRDFTDVVGAKNEFVNLLNEFYGRFFGLRIFDKDVSLLLHYASARIAKTSRQFNKFAILATDVIKNSRKKTAIMDSEKQYLAAWSEVYGRQVMISNEFSVGRFVHHLAPQAASIVRGVGPAVPAPAATPTPSAPAEAMSSATRPGLYTIPDPIADAL